MNDMRGIAERIPAILRRRSELVAAGPADRAEREELSGLESDASRFDDMCIRHHRLNLCQAGLVFGDVLRHPADPLAGASVRLGDMVEIVEGPDARQGEMPIMEATALMARRLGRGLAFRDWSLAGVSLGAREDALLRERSGLPPAAAPQAPPSPPASDGETRPASSPESAAPTAAEPRTAPRPRRARHDDRTPDLFG
jgi:hypothetical protein